MKERDEDNWIQFCEEKMLRLKFALPLGTGAAPRARYHCRPLGGNGPSMANGEGTRTATMANGEGTRVTTWLSASGSDGRWRRKELSPWMLLYCTCICPLPYHEHLARRTQ